MENRIGSDRRSESRYELLAVGDKLMHKVYFGAKSEREAMEVVNDLGLRFNKYKDLRMLERRKVK